MCDVKKIRMERREDVGNGMRDGKKRKNPRLGDDASSLILEMKLTWAVGGVSDGITCNGQVKGGVSGYC